MKNALFASLILTVASAATGLTQGGEAAKPFVSVEAALCTSVEDRLPVGQAEAFSPDVDKVYLWCKVIGAEDTTFIKHVWMFQGDEMAVVQLPVKSPSWRTWSSKNILPQWTGGWEVKIRDAEDNLLRSVAFKIERPAEEAREEPPADLPPDSLKTK